MIDVYAIVSQEGKFLIVRGLPVVLPAIPEFLKQLQEFIMANPNGMEGFRVVRLVEMQDAS